MTRTLFLGDQYCSTTKSSPGLGWRRKCEWMFLFVDGCCEVSPDQTTVKDLGVQRIGSAVLTGDGGRDTWDPIGCCSNLHVLALRVYLELSPASASLTEERRLPILKILPRCRARSRGGINKRSSTRSCGLL